MKKTSTLPNLIRNLKKRIKMCLLKVPSISQCGYKNVCKFWSKKIILCVVHMPWFKRYRQILLCKLLWVARILWFIWFKSDHQNMEYSHIYCITRCVHVYILWFKSYHQLEIFIYICTYYGMLCVVHILWFKSSYQNFHT